MAWRKDAASPVLDAAIKFSKYGVKSRDQSKH